MSLLEMDVDMSEEKPNGAMSPGEVTRTLQRIERGIDRIEQQMIPEVLSQVSNVRHRVANLEQTSLFKESFMRDYGILKNELQHKADKAEVEELERKTVAAEAVAAYKKFLLVIGLFGGGGFVVSVIALFKA